MMSLSFFNADVMSLKRVTVWMGSALFSVSVSATSSALADPQAQPSYYGTLHPFAARAIYFVLTDRFVDGDPSNNFTEQNSFDIPILLKPNHPANVGYQGGDFKGLLNNADYVADMGFGAVWLTPIIDNPAAAFPGGDPIRLTGFGMDQGKSGYHGYWGSNFYQLDEHLPSADLNFAQLTERLSAHGLATILDVVINHGSPAYSMPQPVAEFGQIFAEDGTLLADHQNLAPTQLQPQQPLHRMFARQADLAQLADFDFNDPQVLQYHLGATLKWLEQGASALRLDTVKHVPAEIWQRFLTQIRLTHPNLFAFGEVYSFDPQEIGQYTYLNEGAMSVLDFPQKRALTAMMEQGAGFEVLADTLYLTPFNGEQGAQQQAASPYANPYELATFYDNHDMSRVDTDDQGLIDAHNWLFTARGIPVIYYGSEMGFARGKAEHLGNRNYFGQVRIEQAKKHPVQQALKRIAKVRQQSIALQRGLMLPLELAGDRAAFMRVYQHQNQAQQALVLLNKGDTPTRFQQQLQTGLWQEALTGVTANGTIDAVVAPHSVQVWLLDAVVQQPALAAALAPLMPTRQ
ncbi:MAG: alpha-amylase family glycosyl hydrolase [Ferrimonas sp.]